MERDWGELGGAGGGLTGVTRRSSNLSPSNRESGKQTSSSSEFLFYRHFTLKYDYQGITRGFLFANFLGAEAVNFV